MTYMRWIFCFLGLLIGLSACDDCSFTSENLQTVRLQFLRNGEPTAIRFAAVYSQEAIQDSLYRGDSLNVFLLPLLTSQTTVAYVFAYLDSLQTPDTLTLAYRVRAIPIAPDCGVDEEISQLEVLRTSFPRAEVLQPTLLNIHEIDLQIELEQ